MLRTLALVLIKNTMVAMMLAVGLSLSTRALRATWAERALVVRALLVVELGVPLLALATVRVLPLHYVTSAIIATMAVCPGAPMIVRQVRDRAVIPVLLAVICLLTPLTVTFWLAVLSHALPQDLFVGASTVARIMILKQVLPMALGAAIAALVPRAARPIARVSWGVFLSGLTLALVVVLVQGAPVLLRANGWDVLAIVIVVAGSLAMGHVAGRPRADDSFALAVIAVLGNPGLGAAVIAASYPDLPALSLMAAYLLARTLALSPYLVHAQRRPTAHDQDAGLRGLLHRPAVTGNPP